MICLHRAVLLLTAIAIIFAMPHFCNAGDSRDSEQKALKLAQTMRSFSTGKGAEGDFFALMVMYDETSTSVLSLQKKGSHDFLLETDGFGNPLAFGRDGQLVTLDPENPDQLLVYSQSHWSLSLRGGKHDQLSFACDDPVGASTASIEWDPASFISIFRKKTSEWAGDESADSYRVSNGRYDAFLGREHAGDNSQQREFATCISGSVIITAMALNDSDDKVMDLSKIEIGSLKSLGVGEKDLDWSARADRDKSGKIIVPDFDGVSTKKGPVALSKVLPVRQQRALLLKESRLCSISAAADIADDLDQDPDHQKAIKKQEDDCLAQLDKSIGRYVVGDSDFASTEKEIGYDLGFTKWLMKTGLSATAGAEFAVRSLGTTSPFQNSEESRLSCLAAASCIKDFNDRGALDAETTTKALAIVLEQDGEMNVFGEKLLYGEIAPEKFADTVRDAASGYAVALGKAIPTQELATKITRASESAVVTWELRHKQS